MDWRWDFTFEVVLPRMVQAAGVTIWATFASFCVALVLGLLLMLLKTSSRKWISWPAGELIEFISRHTTSGTDLLSVLHAP